MRLEAGTWVLVVDGAKALILENAGDSAHPELRVVRKEENDAPDNRGEATTGPAPEGDAPRSTADETHQFAEHRFAEGVARDLYLAAHRGRFQRLVIVAPPKVLGTLRKALHKEVASRLVGEVHKTLTSHPVPEIERILAAEPEAS